MTKEEMREQYRQFAHDVLARAYPSFIMPVLEKDMDVVVDFIEDHDARIRAEALKEAAERAEAEKVDAEETGSEGDYAYNRGIDDAIRAILSDTKPNEETR